MRRKKVPADLNLEFTTVWNVIQAREALVTQEAKEAARQVRYNASARVRELAEQSIEPLQSEWQIDNL
jgi:hypothetical protein